MYYNLQRISNNADTNVLLCNCDSLLTLLELPSLIDVDVQAFVVDFPTVEVFELTNDNILYVEAIEAAEGETVYPTSLELQRLTVDDGTLIKTLQHARHFELEQFKTFIADVNTIAVVLREEQLLDAKV